MNEPANLEDALGALGEILAYRGTPYELVIVGGSALLLMGMLVLHHLGVEVTGGQL